MFLKAVALGMSVPAAMRLSRMATAQTRQAAQAVLPDVHPARDRARALQSRRSPAPTRWCRPTTRPSTSTRRTSASWGRCSPTSSTSTSTRAFSTPAPADTHDGRRQLPVGLDGDRHDHRAHHGRARDREGAQRQAADPRRLLAHHERPRQERDVVLERHRRSIPRRARSRRSTTCSAAARPRRPSTPTCSCTRTCSRSPPPRCRGCRRRCRA